MCCAPSPTPLHTPTSFRRGALSAYLLIFCRFSGLSVNFMLPPCWSGYTGSNDVIYHQWSMQGMLLATILSAVLSSDFSDVHNGFRGCHGKMRLFWAFEIWQSGIANVSNYYLLLYICIYTLYMPRRNITVTHVYFMFNQNSMSLWNHDILGMLQQVIAPSVRFLFPPPLTIDVPWMFFMST